MDLDFYLEFENNFRGDRQSVLKKNAKYHRLVNSIINERNDLRMLDVGCGRGEWLEYWKTYIPQSIGIEKNKNMIETCKKYELNIIEGEAIKSLSNLDSNTFDIITIFHLIEHLNNDELFKILLESYRVLKDDGVLLLETPSIDNLIVSTNLFYLDPTHVNPINSESLSFCIKKIGFNEVKTFYINGGPLENTNHNKITRIFNGVAQDLFVICTKSSNITKKIFSTESYWSETLSVGVTTMQAAIDFDLNVHKYNLNNNNLIKDQQNRIKCLEDEVLVLSQKLKKLLFFLNLLHHLCSPLLKLIKYFQRLILKLLNSLFKLLASKAFTNRLLRYKYPLKLIVLLSRLLSFNSTKLKTSHIINKLNKLTKQKSPDVTFNKKLEVDYNFSSSSKHYYNLLQDKKLDK